MTTLYLVRHGQTEWNLQQRMQGWQDSPLTEKGIQQARLLGARLQDIEFAAIYASSSGRAMETARLIRGARDIPILTDENLREIGLGAWEGRTAEEIEQAYLEPYAAFWNAPHRYRPVDGESFMQVRQRVLAALDSILAAHKGQSVLLVSHTVVLKLLVGYFEARTIEELWDPPYIHEASLSIVQVQGGNMRVLTCGDIAHLASC